MIGGPLQGFPGNVFVLAELVTQHHWFNKGNVQWKKPAGAAKNYPSRH
jgi:hypothetical protein